MPISATQKKEIMQYEEEQKREWNKLIIAHIKRVEAIKKPSVQFPNTIVEACDEYFALCEKDGVKPSVAGLGLALGVSRSTLLSWVRGEVSTESSDVLQHYFNIIEVFDETALKDNRVNALAGVFGMKNNYDYKDQVEHKIVDEREISNEEIEMRYRQMHEIVGEEVKELEVKPAKVEKKKYNKDKVDDESIPF